MRQKRERENRARPLISLHLSRVVSRRNHGYRIFSFLPPQLRHIGGSVLYIWNWIYTRLTIGQTHCGLCSYIACFFFVLYIFHPCWQERLFEIDQFAGDTLLLLSQPEDDINIKLWAVRKWKGRQNLARVREQKGPRKEKKTWQQYIV
jgi:hypothetical protein